MAPLSRSRKSPRRRYVIKPDAPKPKTAVPVAPTVAQPAASQVAAAAAPSQQAAVPQTPKLPEQQVASMKTSVPQPPSHTAHPSASPASTPEQVPAKVHDAPKPVSATQSNAHTASPTAAAPAAPKAVVTKSFFKKKKPKMAFLFDNAPSAPATPEVPQEAPVAAEAEAVAADAEPAAAPDASLTEETETLRGEEVKKDAIPTTNVTAAESQPSTTVASAKPVAPVENIAHTPAPAVKTEESPAVRTNPAPAHLPKRATMKASRVLTKKRHSAHVNVEAAPKAPVPVPDVAAEPVTASAVAEEQAPAAVSQSTTENTTGAAAEPAEIEVKTAPQEVTAEEVESPEVVTKSAPIPAKNPSFFDAATMRRATTHTRLSYLEGLQATDDYISTISLSSAAEPHFPDAEYNEAEVTAFYTKAARNNRRIRRSPPDKKQRKREGLLNRQEMLAKMALKAQEAATGVVAETAAATESKPEDHNVTAATESNTATAPETLDAPQALAEEDIPTSVDATLSEGVATEAPTLPAAATSHKLPPSKTAPAQAAARMSVQAHHSKRAAHKNAHITEELSAPVSEKTAAAAEEVATPDVAEEREAKTAAEGIPKNPKLSFLFEEDVKPLPIVADASAQQLSDNVSLAAEQEAVEAVVDDARLSSPSSTEEVSKVNQAEETPTVSAGESGTEKVSIETPQAVSAPVTPTPTKQQRVATSSRLTKKMKKLRQKALARKPTYKNTAATEIDEVVEAAEVAEEIEDELAQRRVAASKAEKEAAMVAARQSMSKPGNILNDAHLFHHVAVKSGVVEKPEVVSAATAAATPTHVSETANPPVPVGSVGATAAAMPSAEALVAESSLVFPDHGVEIQTFNDSEMVIERPNAESPWDIGLRFDWGTKQLAMGSLPAIPAADVRLQHPYMKLYQSRPMWFLKEVNGIPATKIHNVMGIMKDSVRVHFVFRK